MGLGIKGIRDNAGNYKNYKDIFTAVLGVLRGYKARMMKNSPIFWVVEIIEHELWRIVEHRKNEMQPHAEMFL
jgi:hypothetical protein